MPGVQKISVIVKNYEPYDNEVLMNFKQGITINELIKKLRIKSIDDYAVLINGLSITDFNTKLRDGQKIVLLPKTLGG
jgi:molybdopterin converting factor small subunit